MIVSATQPKAFTNPIPGCIVCVYLWYVMEKARLVLVREKRARATPLELGSHESEDPVSTATKSAQRNILNIYMYMYRHQLACITLDKTFILSNVHYKDLKSTTPASCV